MTAEVAADGIDAAFAVAETPSTDAPASSPADAAPAISLRTFTDAVIALTSLESTSS
ncbi:hypothetical protein GCM10019017_25180 [Streptomyces showdoensis]